MCFSGLSDKKNESARKIHFDPYKKIITIFCKRKKLEVIKVRKNFGRKFSRSKIFDFFRSHFSYIFEWKFSKFLRSKNFQKFSIFSFKIVWKKRNFRKFSTKKFRTLITSNFFRFQNFLMIFLYGSKWIFRADSFFFYQKVIKKSLERIKREML